MLYTFLMFLSFHPIHAQLTVTKKTDVQKAGLLGTVKQTKVICYNAEKIKDEIIKKQKDQSFIYPFVKYDPLGNVIEEYEEVDSNGVSVKDHT